MDGASAAVQELGGQILSWDFVSSLFSHPSAIAFTAVIIELAIPIPCSCRIGALSPIFRAMARKVNLASNTSAQGYFAGAMLEAVIVGAALALVLLLHVLTGFDTILSLVFLPFLLDSGSAVRCSLRTRAALRKGDKDRARQALSRFCQRDTERLSPMGICKAASEYAAISMTASWLGVIAWFEVLGLEGAVAMAMVTTLARTFPAKYPEFRSFGYPMHSIFQAMLVLPCAVLTVLMPLSLSPRRSFKRAVRGALDYPASVSGYALGALGGCANVSMGGPRSYRGEVVRFPRVGGFEQPGENAALRITRRASFVGIVFATACMVVPLALG
ncbi:MAG: cobalamin biosynthesis protein [Succinivibrio sp.]